MAGRAGVSAHDLLRSGEPRVGGGRAREERRKEGKKEKKEGRRKRRRRKVNGAMTTVLQ